MRKLALVMLATSVLCVICFAAVGPTQAEGFQLPNLNPFAKKKPVDRTARFERNRDGSSGSLLPSFPKIEMPTLGGKTTRQANKPSTFSRMTSGTKSFWQKTKSTLLPWSADDAPKTSMPPLGSRNNQKKKPAKTSLFPWFSQAPKEPEIKSVNDFLALPQPSF